MMKIIGFLIVLAMIAVIAQPATAFRFEIYVQYENDGPVNRAFVEIFDGDNLVDSDYTNSDGIYVAYLSEGRYTFRATKNDKVGSRSTSDANVHITIR
jgi:hypothetical protein